jgi:predicted DCC family thiol-disulfide oxidoreductase YuxK
LAPSRSRAVLVYDAGCGPCTTFKGAVALLDVGRQIRFESIEKADADGLLDPVPEGLRRASSHLVLPDGTVLSGASYLPELVAAFPGGGLVAVCLRKVGPMRSAAVFGFEVLSRLHGVSGCDAGRARPPLILK